MTINSENRALGIQSKPPGSRRPFDRLRMFKTIILQHYDNLSEEQRKFQLKDNLSFIDFLGLHLTEKVPDENTI